MGIKEAWAALWAEKKTTTGQPAPGRPIAEHEVAAAGASMQRDPAYQPLNDPSSQLGPGVAPAAMPLGGEPRQMQYRPGWNIPSPPGEGRIDAGTLRFFADNYDLLRRCIEVRKAEIRGLEWDIVPVERNKAKSLKLREKHSGLIAQIKAFFDYPEAYMAKSPDGKGWMRRGYVTWDEWLGACLEEYFVGDWVTIYPRRKLNGEMLRLDRVDGSTIKVLLTVDGRTPLPPEPAYVQWLHGRVAVRFTLEELIYKPRTRRNHTPYGYSHVEQILAHINEAIRYQMWTMAYFTDGSIPEGFFTSPEGWSIDQIREFNEYINAALAGDPKALRQFHLIPHGSTYLPVKPFQFDDKFARFLAEKTCVLMDVQPTEVGWTPQSGLGGAGFSEGQEAVTKRKSLGPLARWLQGLFTDIIHNYFGATDLCFSFTSLQGEDEGEQVDTDQKRLLSGQATLDQILMERGEEPVGVNKPMILAGTQLLFLPDLLTAQKHGINAVTGFGGFGLGGGPGPYGGGPGGPGDPTGEEGDEDPDPDGQVKPPPRRPAPPADEDEEPPTDANKAAASDDADARAAVAAVMRRDYPSLPEAWADAYNWRPARVKVDSIQAGRRPSKRNPDKLEALLEAIEAGEELPPLIVVEEGDERQMVDGYHRWWAYREAGREYVEVYLGEPAWHDLYRPGGDAYEQEREKAAVAEDLARWKRKALKTVKAGRRPGPFVSAVIPAEQAAVIAATLAGARTADDVKAAFRAPRQRIVRLVPQNPARVGRATQHMAQLLQGAMREEAERFADWLIPRLFPEGDKAPLADVGKISAPIDDWDWSEWVDMLIDPLAAELRKIHRQGMYDVFATLEFEDSFSLRNERAEAYARQRGAQLVGRRVLPSGQVIDNPNPEFTLSDSTREMLRGTITRSMEQGLPPAQLREQIVNDYAFSPTRANAIANTETAFAYNDASIDAYAEAGVTRVRVEDGDGCEPCIKANGQVWTLEQARANPLEHPHCKRVFYPIVEV